MLFRDGAGKLISGASSIAVPPMYAGENELHFQLPAERVPEGVDLNTVDVDFFPAPPP